MNKQTRWRRKQRDSGLVPFECWCRPEDRDAIRAFAEILRSENAEFAGFSAAAMGLPVSVGQTIPHYDRDQWLAGYHLFEGD